MHWKSPSLAEGIFCLPGKAGKPSRLKESGNTPSEGK